MFSFGRISWLTIDAVSRRTSLMRSDTVGMGWMFIGTAWAPPDCCPCHGERKWPGRRRAEGHTSGRSGSPRLRSASVTIRYDVHDGIATITIDRPEKRNAMTYAILRDFNAAVVRAGGDD